MPSDDSRTKVTIFTGSYRIRGYLDLIPGARVTDFMTEAKTFIAITDAEVFELEVGGRHLISAAFINVSRDHVHIVVPDA